MNGYFDPLTLSINEQTNQAFRQNPLYRDGGHGYYSFEDLDSATGRKFDGHEDHFASKISKHEHDHFVKHTSSEYGLFLSLLLIIRQEQRKSGILFSNKPDGGQTELTEAVINVMFSSSSSLTQKEAVEIVNRWYRNVFNIDVPIVKTVNPEEPAILGSFLGYRNILESLAVLKEITFYMGHFDFSEEQLGNFINIKERDQILYFELLSHLRVKFSDFWPAISNILNFSLDVRVPILGSSTPIPLLWEEFHPSWRVHLIVEYLEPGFKKMSVPKTGLSGYRAMNAYGTQKAVYDWCSKVIGDGLNFTLWHEVNRKYQPSVEQWSKIMTKPFQAYLLRRYNYYYGWKGVLDHLTISFNAFRNEYATNYLQFFGTGQFFFSDQETKNLNNLKGFKKDSNPLTKSFALFSVLNNAFDSVHWPDKPLDVLSGILRLVENELMTLYESGTAINEIKNILLERLPKFQLDVLKDQYFEIIDQVINGYSEQIETLKQ